MTQQKIVGKVKKEYTPPSDPGWSKQWSLVSLSDLMITTICFQHFWWLCNYCEIIEKASSIIIQFQHITIQGKEIFIPAIIIK